MGDTAPPPKVPFRPERPALDPWPETAPKHGTGFRYRAPVARTKQPPKSAEDRRVVGGLLRELRKAAGYRSVDAAAVVAGAPSSRQTIYAYERGGLTPSLAQLRDIVEFYVLRALIIDGRRPRMTFGPGGGGRHRGVTPPSITSRAQDLSHGCSRAFAEAVIIAW